MSTPIERQLVVFDFDWSLADQDSDRWIFEVLAPELRRKMKNLKKEMQWTDLVAMSLRELHEKGATREDIENALRQMPFHPAMVRGVTALKNKSPPQTTFLCLSNANIVFITTILKSKGLENLFNEIITNPAEWDASGLLKLRRRIDPNGPQHQCKAGCSPNMCKGDELEAFLQRHPAFDRVIYVGDGSNDFCPVMLKTLFSAAAIAACMALSKGMKKAAALHAKCAIGQALGKSKKYSDNSDTNVRVELRA
ncbi:Inorganic pyrophosphatase 1 [Grifola frondosa]|uniref:Inorganic pyrophosphatase 1 n=1 Tax=Grifola frondosa TaxID=5627 RepID=A0A1C7LSQ6_GRIFR|nr:Inorganic pyrophosphatase 1 [Grifola frondosa]